MREPSRVTTGDLYVLDYARHMAATARSTAARHLFEAYLNQERLRLAGNNEPRTPRMTGVRHAPDGR